MLFLKQIPLQFRTFLLNPNVCRLPQLITPKCRNIHSTTACYSNSILNIKPRNFKDNYYRKRDHIADEYHIVYQTPLNLTIACAKQVANISLSLVGAVVLYKYFNNLAILDPNTTIDLGDGSIMASGWEIYGFLIAFPIFNAAILYMCRKFPLRIYKNKSSYVAMFEGNIPMMAKPYEFAKGEVVHQPNAVVPWGDSMYRLRRKTVVLLPPYFKTPSELHQMMLPSKAASKKESNE